jgi:hypothetical protein
VATREFGCWPRILEAPSRGPSARDSAPPTSHGFYAKAFCSVWSGRWLAARLARNDARYSVALWYSPRARLVGLFRSGIGGLRDGATSEKRDRSPHSWLGDWPQQRQHDASEGRRRPSPAPRQCSAHASREPRRAQYIERIISERSCGTQKRWVAWLVLGKPRLVQTWRLVGGGRASEARRLILLALCRGACFGAYFRAASMSALNCLLMLLPKMLVVA